MTPAPSRCQHHGRSRRSEGRRLRKSRHAPGRLLRHEQAGFTLIETLAAFAVLTLTLVILFADLSGVVQRGRGAEDMREALRLAQSKLDALGVTEPLTPGESTGRFFNRFEWRMHVREVKRGTNARVMCAWVEITVSAPATGTRNPHAVSLVTLKLQGVSSR
jgi:general secretion pathway protein I